MNDFFTHTYTVLIKPEPEWQPKTSKVLTFVRQLKYGKGLVIIATVIQDNETMTPDEIDDFKDSLKDLVKKERLDAFVQIVHSSTAFEGIRALTQTAGLGGLRPNTILMGWPYGWREDRDHLKVNAFVGM